MVAPERVPVGLPSSFHSYFLLSLLSRSTTRDGAQETKPAAAAPLWHPSPTHACCRSCARRRRAAPRSCPFGPRACAPRRRRAPGGSPYFPHDGGTSLPAMAELSSYLAVNTTISIIVDRSSDGEFLRIDFNIRCSEILSQQQCIKLFFLD